MGFYSLAQVPKLDLIHFFVAAEYLMVGLMDCLDPGSSSGSLVAVLEPTEDNYKGQVCSSYLLFPFVEAPAGESAHEIVGIVVVPEIGIAGERSAGIPAADYYERMDSAVAEVHCGVAPWDSEHSPEL